MYHVVLGMILGHLLGQDRAAEHHCLCYSIQPTQLLTLHSGESLAGPKGLKWSQAQCQRQPLEMGLASFLSGGAFSTSWLPY